MKTSRRPGALLAALVLGLVSLFTTTLSASASQQPGTQRAKVGFMIASNMNNRCLEVRGANPGSGALVAMWDCFGGTSERWYWAGNTIRSDLNGKCLDVAAGNSENGAALNAWDCHGGAPQQWVWDGTRLRNPAYNRCLTIANANWGNGAAVIIWDCNLGSHQQWHTT
ncbi:Extracellular exo-alpha-L-arabinofuranosidase precursor [Streptomyces sp. YIM 121038]|uniref:RICIN domain-containing protein n=1 Tax=Streptomyces sp. YIM 121038 TaxID=2136401 RepID=UPI0011107A97|nr:RICIN domain-containing protein [Streptomyces sp. YIM 121038]QCX81452.1 Extracellular exo-alpha-L-arabinofuranosidase precursor [Streptomyces sp. YIM 121038]